MSWLRPESVELCTFEKIAEDLSHGMHRLKVPGGWLVALRGVEAVAVIFYPDPRHEWELNQRASK